MDPNRYPATGRYHRKIIAYLLGFLAMAGVLALVSIRRTTTHLPIRSVLVLPFSDPTTSASQSYLGLGMSAALATQLGELEDLEVPSPDLWSLIDASQSPPRLAARLGLDLILAGDLEVEAGAVEIQLRLIEPGASSDPRIVRVVGSPEHMIDLQLELLGSVAAELGISLSSRQTSRFRRALTRSQKAYDDYLRGAAYLANLALPKGPLFAIDLLRRAVQLDPQFSMAHSDLGRALWRASIRASNEPQEDLAEGLKAVERALDRTLGLRTATVTRILILRELAPTQSCSQSIQRWGARWENDAEISMDMAAAYLQIGALQSAEDCLRSAIASDPENWRTWSRWGDFLWRTGRVDEARVSYQEADAVSPATVVSPNQSLALLSLQTGDFSEAIAQFEIADRAPFDAEISHDLSIAYSLLEDPAQAERLARMASSLSPNQPRHLEHLGDVLERAGKQEEAESVYKRALQLIDDSAESRQIDTELQISSALIAAKAAACDRALPEATTLHRHTDSNAEMSYQLAQIFSICRQRNLTLEAISKALDRGLPREQFQSSPYFQWLGSDEKFQLMVEDPESTPGSV